MEIAVGLDRKKAREFVRELSAALDAAGDDGEFDVTLYGDPSMPSEDDGTGDADVRFSNDDMERPEVEGSVYVSIERG